MKSTYPRVTTMLSSECGAISRQERLCRALTPAVYVVAKSRSLWHVSTRIQKSFQMLMYIIDFLVQLVEYKWVTSAPPVAIVQLEIYVSAVNWSVCLSIKTCVLDFNFCGVC